MILYEAPHRLAATLSDLVERCGPLRQVAVIRELTKLHEEVWRGDLRDAADAFASREVRGEVVLVIGGAVGAEPPAEADVEQAVRAVLADDPSAGPRQVAERVAASLSVPRRRAYEAALRVRKDAGTERP
jgi:16S rRNA (cytidine1402-2'-O)-methyltransferase